MEEPKGLLNQKEVALFLNVHRKTIRRWKRGYDFPKPVKKTGRSWMWAAETILAYKLNRGQLGTTGDIGD
jgi:predicted DNA-binding transcriptional regulator AlpA